MDQGRGQRRMKERVGQVRMDDSEQQQKRDEAGTIKEMTMGG